MAAYYSIRINPKKRREAIPDDGFSHSVSPVRKNEVNQGLPAVVIFLFMFLDRMRPAWFPASLWSVLFMAFLSSIIVLFLSGVNAYFTRLSLSLFIYLSFSLFLSVCLSFSFSLCVDRSIYYLSLSLSLSIS